MYKKYLLNIKEFATLCNVHPAALRRYDALGVLKPTYVDPENGYRYYDVCQRDEVFAIQFAVEAGIPLKELAQYDRKETSSIQFKELFDRGTVMLEQRIEMLQKLVQNTKNLCSHIDRAEQLHAAATPLHYTLDGSYFLITPCENINTDIDWRKYFRKYLKELAQAGLAPTYSGLLQQRCGNEWKQYFAFQIDGNSEGLIDQDRLFYIAKGEWLCKKAESDRIEDIWDWSAPYVDPEDVEILMHIELFVGDYDYQNPPMEQRCLIKKHGTT